MINDKHIRIITGKYFGRNDLGKNGFSASIREITNQRWKEVERRERDKWTCNHRETQHSGWLLPYSKSVIPTSFPLQSVWGSFIGYPVSRYDQDPMSLR